MPYFEKILSGGDLRSVRKSNSVLLNIHNQNDFDELFKYLFHPDRLVVMRTADALEKITINRPQYLAKHTHEIMKLCDLAKNKELKWHLALLIPRLTLENKDFDKAWNTLTKWARDKTNSRIVRVNSLQGLFEMMMQNNKSKEEFILTILELEKENIPSIDARIRNIRNRIL